MKTNTLFKSILKTVAVIVFLLAITSFKNSTSVIITSTEEVKQTRKTADSLNIQLSLNDVEIDLERKDVQVLLTVDTERINERNIEDMVVFSNLNEDNPRSSAKPKDFVTLVYKNKKISWSAVAKDEDSDVSIDVLAIFRKEDGGAEIMEDIYIAEGKKGVVVAKIKKKKVEGIESYSVVFRINEASPRTFVVDPKLKMGFD